MTSKGNAPAGDGSTADRGTAPVTFSIKLPRQYCSAPHHHPPRPHLFQRRQIQIILYHPNHPHIALFDTALFRKMNILFE